MNMHIVRSALVVFVVAAAPVAHARAQATPRPLKVVDPKEHAARAKAAADLAKKKAAEEAQSEAEAEAEAPVELAQAKPAAPPAPAAAKPAEGAGDTKVSIDNCKPVTGKLSFNFEKASILEVLDHISRIRCMNFIVSEAVKGKSDITIISRSSVTVDQAYAAFLAALEANNMALVPAGKYWKVVERAGSAKSPLPLFQYQDGRFAPIEASPERTQGFPSSDAQVTMLYEIRYANKDTVQGIIRNLMSKNADLQIAGTNLLLLTDSGSNIIRITEILDKLDQPGGSTQIHTVEIKFSDAQNVAQKLTEIFGVGAQAKGTAAAAKPAPRPRPTAKKDAPVETPAAGADSDDGGLEEVAIEKIVPDERLNRLIIIASERAFKRVKEVIDILDQPSGLADAATRVYVVPLNHADAQKISSTLSQLAQGSAAKKPADAKGKGALEAAKAAALFEGEVKVTADETTNSLVITASGRDFNSLRRVIEELDARRPQVFVEAAIMEIGLNQSRDVGLNAYAGYPVDVPGLGTGLGIVANEGGRQLFIDSAKTVAGQAILRNVDPNRIDPSQLSTLVDASSGLESLLGFLAFQGPPIPGTEQIFGFAVPSFGAVLNLLQTNANVDVLSTPHLMTTDNEKAEISVGQKVPVVKGIAPVSGGGNFGFGGLQQISYEDVKLKFALTPHVNVDDEVRIELEQEVSDLGGEVSVGNGLTQPIITNRSIKTTVVMKDQQTVVIGGLISDRKNETERKVPFLGDVPIIGWLFKTFSDDGGKTNLVLVLTPYIVRDDDDFRKIYERKMRERQEFVDAYLTNAGVYNPYVDFTKKTGPVGKLVKAIQVEENKIENGGSGNPGEVLIGPTIHSGSKGDGSEAEGTEGNGAEGDAPPPSELRGPPQAPEGATDATTPAPATPDAPPAQPPSE